MPSSVRSDDFGAADDDLAGSSRFASSLDDEEKTIIGTPSTGNKPDNEEDGFELDDFAKPGASRSQDTGRSRLRSDTIEYTAAEEKRMLKKLDRRVVLFVALLYLLSFLDRSNIGNARIAGMEQDLALKAGQYEWLLTAFYITYIAFEWMALLFRLFRPSVYLATCVLAWGILASLQSVTNSFASLLVLRALLGVSEAAFAGVPFYLSFFFRNDELAARVGIFISAAPLATTFASSLAWAITWLGGRIKLWAPWRLLFLVEGFPSVIVAYYVWQHMPDGPESARFLSAREKDITLSRLQGEKKDAPLPSSGEKTPKKPKINVNEIVQALKDPKCYLAALMFFSCNVAFSSMPVFLPTIIKEMGWSSLASQALSAPPYLVAFFVVLATAYASDKAKARSPFIMLHAGLACSGYVLIFLAGLLGLPSWIRYLGVYPACAGFFTCVTLIITWTLNNQNTDSGKGTGVALLQYFGQCGPLLGTRLYPESDGPLYLKGMAVCALFMALVGLLAVFLRWRLRRENAVLERDGLLEDDDEDEGLLDQEGGQRLRSRRSRKTFRYLI